MVCIGCYGAPEYEPGDAPDIIYCGSECQAKDWPHHKGSCLTRRKRKALVRAAVLLKAAFMTYREVNYNFNVTKVEVREGVLHVEYGAAPQMPPFAFPNNITANPQHKEAALGFGQSHAAVCLVSTLARELLEGRITYQWLLKRSC